MDEQLFEWETKRKPKPKKVPDAELVDRPRAYMAIATAKNGPTWHRVRYVDKANASEITWCGLVGHRVSNGAKRVPLCVDCEDAWLKEATARKE